MCVCVSVLVVVPFDKFVSIYIVIKHTRLHSGNLAYKWKIEITAHVGGGWVLVTFPITPSPLQWFRVVVSEKFIGFMWRFQCHRFIWQPAAPFIIPAARTFRLSEIELRAMDGFVQFLCTLQMPKCRLKSFKPTPTSSYSISTNTNKALH